MCSWGWCAGGWTRQNSVLVPSSGQKCHCQAWPGDREETANYSHTCFVRVMDCDKCDYEWGAKGRHVPPTKSAPFSTGAWGWLCAGHNRDMQTGHVNRMHKETSQNTHFVSGKGDFIDAALCTPSSSPSRSPQRQTLQPAPREGNGQHLLQFENKPPPTAITLHPLLSLSPQSQLPSPAPMTGSLLK